MGFEIFMFSKTKKVILDSCFGVVHLGDTTVSMSYIKPFSKIWKKNVAADVARYNKFCKFSAQELEAFKNGEDLVLQNKRMKKIAKRSKKLLK